MDPLYAQGQDAHAGQGFPEGIQIPDFFFGKNIVHLPTIKCHIYTTTTGAMKNAFGGLLATHRHYTHSVIHETLVDLLAIQKEIHPGIFAIMDGTTAGDGPGPRTMRPHVKNILLASSDQVAIDAVAARLMGFNPMDIKYIHLAHRAGLGVGKPEEIQLVGDDISGEKLELSPSAITWPAMWATSAGSGRFRGFSICFSILLSSTSLSSARSATTTGTAGL